MADLFQKDRTVITRHINNVFKEGELNREEVCAKIAHTTRHSAMEEKAAMLLYLVTKNHSFSDGNKRIAATLFLWFLNNNGILYRSDGTKRLADNTLVALTLMIAESRTEEKDVMVKVVVNLINQRNE
jgi:prophage maintenance system killer protein